MMAFEKKNELYHHGIKGMKWGIRRYENYDGTLTAAGKQRYSRRDQMRDNAKAYVQKASKAQRDEEKRQSAKLKDLEKRNPKEILSYRNVTTYGNDGKKTKQYPYYVKDEITRVKASKERAKVLADNWDSWEKYFSTVPASEIKGNDLRLAKKYAKRHLKDKPFDTMVNR